MLRPQRTPLHSTQYTAHSTQYAVRSINSTQYTVHSSTPPSSQRREWRYNIDTRYTTKEALVLSGSSPSQHNIKLLLILLILLILIITAHTSALTLLLILLILLIILLIQSTDPLMEWAERDNVIIWPPSSSRRHHQQQQLHMIPIRTRGSPQARSENIVLFKKCCVPRWLLGITSPPPLAFLIPP